MDPKSPDQKKERERGRKEAPGITPERLGTLVDSLPEAMQEKVLELTAEIEEVISEHGKGRKLSAPETEELMGFVALASQKAKTAAEKIHDFLGNLSIGKEGLGKAKRIIKEGSNALRDLKAREPVRTVESPVDVAPKPEETATVEDQHVADRVIIDEINGRPGEEVVLGKIDTENPPVAEVEPKSGEAIELGEIVKGGTRTIKSGTTAHALAAVKTDFIVEAGATLIIDQAVKCKITKEADSSVVNIKESVNCRIIEPTGVTQEAATPTAQPQEAAVPEKTEAELAEEIIGKLEKVFVDSAELDTKMAIIEGLANNNEKIGKLKELREDYYSKQTEYLRIMGEYNVDGLLYEIKGTNKLVKSGISPELRKIVDLIYSVKKYTPNAALLTVNIRIHDLEAEIKSESTPPVVERKPESPIPPVAEIVPAEPPQETVPQETAVPEKTAQEIFDSLNVGDVIVSKSGTRRTIKEKVAHKQGDIFIQGLSVITDKKGVKSTEEKWVDARELAGEWLDRVEKGGAGETPEKKAESKNIAEAKEAAKRILMYSEKEMGADVKARTLISLQKQYGIDKKWFFSNQVGISDDILERLRAEWQMPETVPETPPVVEPPVETPAPPIPETAPIKETEAPAPDERALAEARLEALDNYKEGDEVYYVRKTKDGKYLLISGKISKINKRSKRITVAEESGKTDNITKEQVEDGSVEFFNNEREAEIGKYIKEEGLALGDQVMLPDGKTKAEIISIDAVNGEIRAKFINSKGNEENGVFPLIFKGKRIKKVAQEPSVAIEGTEPVAEPVVPVEPEKPAEEPKAPETPEMQKEKMIKEIDEIFKTALEGEDSIKKKFEKADENDVQSLTALKESAENLAQKYNDILIDLMSLLSVVEIVKLTKDKHWDDKSKELDALVMDLTEAVNDANRNRSTAGEMANPESSAETAEQRSERVKKERIDALTGEIETFFDQVYALRETFNRSDKADIEGLIRLYRQIKSYEIEYSYIAPNVSRDKRELSALLTKEEFEELSNNRKWREKEDVFKKLLADLRALLTDEEVEATDLELDLEIGQFDTGAGDQGIGEEELDFESPGLEDETDPDSQSFRHPFRNPRANALAGGAAEREEPEAEGAPLLGGEALSPRQERAVKAGLIGIGFYMKKWKSQLMARACKSASGIGDVETDISDRRLAARFAKSLEETYDKDARQAQQGLDSIVERKKRGKRAGLMLSARSGGLASGMMIKFGRTVLEVSGKCVVFPRRWIMMGAMGFSRVVSAAKETRFKNKELKQKTERKSFGKEEITLSNGQVREIETYINGTSDWSVNQEKAFDDLQRRLALANQPLTESEKEWVKAITAFKKAQIDTNGHIRVDKGMVRKIVRDRVTGDYSQVEVEEPVHSSIADAYIELYGDAAYDDLIGTKHLRVWEQEFNKDGSPKMVREPDRKLPDGTIIPGREVPARKAQRLEIGATDAEFVRLKENNEDFNEAISQIDQDNTLTAKQKEQRKKQLIQSYKERLGRHLIVNMEPDSGKLDRLREASKKFVEGQVHATVAAVLQRVERKLKKIDARIDKMQNLTPEQKDEMKKNEKEAVLVRYQKKLEDYDRMVMQFGEVDGLALGLKEAEIISKTVVSALMLEAVFMGASYAWDKLMSGHFDITIPGTKAVQTAIDKQFSFVRHPIDFIRHPASYFTGGTEKNIHIGHKGELAQIAEKHHQLEGILKKRWGEDLYKALGEKGLDRSASDLEKLKGAVPAQIWETDKKLIADELLKHSDKDKPIVIRRLVENILKHQATAKPEGAAGAPHAAEAQHGSTPIPKAEHAAGAGAAAAKPEKPNVAGATEGAKPPEGAKAPEQGTTTVPPEKPGAAGVKPEGGKVPVHEAIPPKGAVPEAAGAHPPVEKAPAITAEQIDKWKIGKGGSFEGSLIKQLMDPETAKKFGFTGKVEELRHWADGEAHRIALETGIVDSKTNAEARFGTAAIKHLSIVLTGEKGHPVIHEFLDGKEVATHGHGAVFVGAEGQKLPEYEYIKDVSKAVKEAAGKAAEAGQETGAKAAGVIKEAVEKAAEAGHEAEKGLFDWHGGRANATEFFEQHSHAFHDLNHPADIKGFHGAYDATFVDTNGDGVPERLIMSSGGHSVGSIENLHFKSLADFQAGVDKLGTDLVHAGTNIDQVTRELNHPGDRVMAIDFINIAHDKAIDLAGFNFDSGIVHGSGFDRLLMEFGKHPDYFRNNQGGFDVTQFRVFKDLLELHKPGDRIAEILSWTQKLDKTTWTMGQESALARLVADHHNGDSLKWVKALFGEKLNTSGVKSAVTGNGIIFRHVGGGGGNIEFDFKSEQIKVGRNWAGLGGETLKLNNLKGAIGWFNEKFNIPADQPDDSGNEMAA